MRILSTVITVIVTLVVANLLLGGVQSPILRIAAVVVIAMIVGAIVNRLVPSDPGRSPERRD
ncbi:hypothetical protein [Kocuria palustris]|uniref:hypothetical protein n=1 Tax=Kocuria palustris TaxID=71999 RepID=UPI0011A6A0F4|nr:hypothetical protein [Kocuria palustris]